MSCEYGPTKHQEWCKDRFGVWPNPFTTSRFELTGASPSLLIDLHFRLDAYVFLAQNERFSSTKALIALQSNRVSLPQVHA